MVMINTNIFKSPLIETPKASMKKIIAKYSSRSLHLRVVLHALSAAVTGSTIFAADTRVSWGNSGGNEFTNPLSWNAFADPGASSELPGYALDSGNSVAIIQSGNAANLNSDFTPANNFDGVLVRSTRTLNINALLNIPGTRLGLENTNVGSTAVNQSAAGSVIANRININNSGGATAFNTYNMNGGSITLSGNLDAAPANGSNFNFGLGGNGVGVSLSAARVQINNQNNNVFTVGAGSSLILSGNNANHIFADGLTVANGGTIGTGNQAATANITSGVVTLQDGATIEYGINGETGASDTWVINDDLDIGVAPLNVNLLVDVVAGDLKQSAGPQVIFDWTGGTGPSPSEFANITWNITGAEGTRVSSLGTVIYGEGLGVNGLEIGQIGLSGFEAFSIPEPSTTGFLLLSGVGITVRRWVQRKQRRGRRLPEV